LFRYGISRFSQSRQHRVGELAGSARAQQHARRFVVASAAGVLD
jgi:hypothetical protein